MSDSLPAGFRFHPTDEELITYYLNCKSADSGFSPVAIADVNLNKCEPWELPGKAKMERKEWYFFSLKDRKYPTGQRANRATDTGYWKTTGKDKEICDSGTMVGMKKTLVFYKGRAPRGEKTNWVKHEFRKFSRYAYQPTKEEWVICRVFRKRPIIKTSQLPRLDSPARSESVNDDSGETNIPIPRYLVAARTSLAAMTNDMSNIPIEDTNLIGVSKNKDTETVSTYVMNWASSFLSSSLLPDSAIPKTQLRSNDIPAISVESATRTYSGFPSDNLGCGAWPMSIANNIYTGSIWQGY